MDSCGFLICAECLGWVQVGGRACRLGKSSLAWNSVKTAQMRASGAVDSVHYSKGVRQHPWCLAETQRQAAGRENYKVEKQGRLQVSLDWGLLAGEAVSGLTRSRPSYVID